MSCLPPFFLGMLPKTLDQPNSWLVPAVVVSGLAIATTLVYSFHINKSDYVYDEDDDDDDDCWSSEGREIPTHLQRLLYKAERRKRSVRFLAMKKPMYDNIEMYDPNGEMLSTISIKKANWYVRKKLAHWKKTTKSIQLNFEPKSRSPEPNLFNQTHKKNICVVCGDNKNYLRHYIVPYCYRTLFPKKYKTHMPHDIVLLCTDCHLHAEQATQRRQKELELPLRKDPTTSRPTISNRELHSVKSVALALSNRRHQLPSDKVEQYEERVKAHFGLCKSINLTDDLLQQAVSMETTVENPNYIPAPTLIVSELASNDDSIREFVYGWRTHFQETMQPRYLPAGWSIESPIHI